VTDGEAGENPPGDAPSCDAGRRSGGRAFGRLPVDVAIEELKEYEQADSGVPRRRWSDSERGAAAPPSFRPVGTVPAAILVDDAAEGSATPPPVPPGGPQFLGRMNARGGPPERRRFRGARAPDAPPPGTRLSAWSRSGPVVRPKSRRAGRAVHVATWLLVIGCIGVGAVAGYPHVRTWLRERSVPAALRSYVDGNGVQYAPAGQGFSVRVPIPPVRRDGVLPATNGQPAIFVHRSIATGAAYEIVIRVVDVPAGLPLPYGAVGLLADPRIGGAGPVNVRRVSLAGRTAYDYDLKSPPSPAVHARMLLDGKHLYVISVQSASAGTVMQALAKSFRLAG